MYLFTMRMQKRYRSVPVNGVPIAPVVTIVKVRAHNLTEAIEDSLALVQSEWDVSRMEWDHEVHPTMIEDLGE